MICCDFPANGVKEDKPTDGKIVGKNTIDLSSTLSEAGTGRLDWCWYWCYAMCFVSVFIPFQKQEEKKVHLVSREQI